MKELVILSGKGGTGKTSITSAFSSLAKNMVLCDADVDAADLHLILKPDFKQVEIFKGGHEAVIDPERCTQCGQCIQLCRFDAIDENFHIDSIACEGCGVCVDLCPENAIDFPETICGQWYISNTRMGPMVHAKLGIAQENSGKLVSVVRQEARKLAKDKNLDFILTDGPPGVGCPVIASIGQASAILIIAEPTVSGSHDMQRVVELAEHFNIPAMLCINKYDLNEAKASEIESIATASGIPVVGRISFDEIFTLAMIKEQNILEYNKNSQAGVQVQKLWDSVFEQLVKNRTVANHMQHL